MIKYKWLAEKLKIQIKDSVLEGKNKLPTEEALGLQYSVSRQTVRQALFLLEEAQLIKRVQGSGSYITGLAEKANMNNINIVLPDANNYIYPHTIHTLTTTLSNAGYNSSIYVTGNKIDKEREILLSLLKNPPRGLILEGSKSTLPNPNIDLLYKLEKLGTIVIFLHNYYVNYRNPLFVVDDNVGGSALLVNYLMDRGYRNIGGIFKSDDQQGIERYYGYTEALINNDLLLEESQIIWYDERDLNSLQEGENSPFSANAVDSLLSTCDACICYNDLITYYFIKKLKSMNYKVPEDIVIASFDNTYLNDKKAPIIYSLAHTKNQLAFEAALLMINKLKGIPVHSQVIPFKLL